jgi:hypothetical protein
MEEPKRGGHNHGGCEETEKGNPSIKASGISRGDENQATKGKSGDDGVMGDRSKSRFEESRWGR